jgi:hypothetical protein
LFLGLWWVFVGCRQKVEQPSNLNEAQEVFQKTSWYWSHAKWVPEHLSEFEISTGGQIFLLKTNSASPTRIIFTELEPKHGLFCFRGTGKLEVSPRLSPPLFELKSGYTADNPDKMIIVGIVKNRMFWVEAEGENRDEVYSNACLVATAALGQLQVK